MQEPYKLVFLVAKNFVSIFLLHIMIAWTFENIVPKGFFEIRSTLGAMALLMLNVSQRFLETTFFELAAKIAPEVLNRF